ncbi:MAG: amidohydrolase [Anaerolineales bacterium]
MSDLILYNGKLHTQDLEVPQANAIALRDGRILAVGDDTDIRALATSETKVVDLEGRRVLPGLTDSHIHFYEWALLLQGLTLEDAASLDEVLERVKESATKAKPGTWIVGQGWNQDRWPDPKLPTRLDLDKVAPNHPTILWRTDLHLAWVNSAALKAAGITAATPDPDMGVIERDGSGQPTGILRELAINLVRDVMPPHIDAQTDEAMRRAMSKVHRLGLTSVHDFRIMGGEDGPPALRAWQRLRAANELNLRAWVLIPGELLNEAITLGLQTGFGDDFLRIGPAKFFSDGATGPRTAWMLESFDDAGTGLPLTPMSQMAEAISKAHKAGISTAIHAIGDRAIRELLDVYTEVIVAQETGTKPRIPHRIEHVQHSHPEDLKRLGPLGLIASVQPLHLTDDMQMVDKACGSRARWAYAFRDLLDAGTVLALGSDCPVASPNPFWGIHAAVTRQTREGKPEGGWYPSQKLSVAEAVWGYTMGAAIATGQETVQGSLTPGKLADLIVLNQDIFEIPPEQLHATKVVMTVFDGRIVYQ